MQGEAKGGKMDRKAMYKLSYGLFILTAKEAEKDNGCIINTAIQAASEPNQLSICVNKANYTLMLPSLSVRRLTLQKRI